MGTSMTQAERRRRHQVRIEQINEVQVVSGRGDCARLDHEATMFERARLLEEEISSHLSTERGIEAFDRLLRLVEQSGQVSHCRDLLQFLDAVWNRHPLPLMLLRGVDPAIGDDMITVLDAFRHARVELAQHVPGGARRVVKVLAARRAEPA